MVQYKYHQVRGFGTMETEEILGVGRQKHSPRILCMICSQKLSVEERRLFLRKNLKTIRKKIKGQYYRYGVCSTCAYRLAAKEAVEFAEDTIHMEADGVKLLEGKKNIDEIECFCRFCLAKLSPWEKTAVEYFKIPFIRVRNRWRGVCGICLLVKEENA